MDAPAQRPASRSEMTSKIRVFSHPGLGEEVVRLLLPWAGQEDAMETTQKQSKRTGTNSTIAALMGIAIGLIAGVSLSHGRVAETSPKASPAVITAPGSPAGAPASAGHDVCELQLG